MFAERKKSGAVHSQEEKVREERLQRSLEDKKEAEGRDWLVENLIRKLCEWVRRLEVVETLSPTQPISGEVAGPRLGYKANSPMN